MVEEYVPKSQISENPAVCPLCTKNNNCTMMIKGDTDMCWCMDGKITFPDSLLAKISHDKKKSACICLACVLAHKV